MKIFNLPDLGEGLPDAEIVEWLVSEGDEIKLDQPMVSMETAKAVVEVPSPHTGRIVKLYGAPGDVIETGNPLAGFEVEAAAYADNGAESDTSASGGETPDSSDSGTVVGKVETSDRVVSELTSVGDLKVTPAVRALARKLKVDLSRVKPSGKNGVITAKDVKTFVPLDTEAEPEPAPVETGKRSELETESPRAKHSSASGAEWEAVRGTRRTMARAMAESHAAVVATTLMDDADVQAWAPGQDITPRLLRSMWAGALAEPGLNAWYDGKKNLRMVHKGMDAGIAVDTPDGLFVVALRNIHSATPAEVRSGIDRLRESVENRSIPPAEMQDYTIVLSNFGKFAGRYATPIVTPPCVAIIAAGKLRQELVPVLGGLEVHNSIPLSLTFDHRACTGGEAARFLKAMIDDLSKPE